MFRLRVCLGSGLVEEMVGKGVLWKQGKRVLGLQEAIVMIIRFLCRLQVPDALSHESFSLCMHALMQTLSVICNVNSRSGGVCSLQSILSVRLAATFDPALGLTTLVLFMFILLRVCLGSGVVEEMVGTGVVEEMVGKCVVEEMVGKCVVEEMRCKPLLSSIPLDRDHGRQPDY